MDASTRDTTTTKPTGYAHVVLDELDIYKQP